jgi:putative membrane protein
MLEPFMSSSNSLVVLLALMTLGCASNETPAPAAAAATAAGPTDPQIAAIVVVANAVDIEAGELARTKSQNAEVKAFAERMIADHTAVNAQASALVAKLRVTPEPNDTSRSLQAGGEATRKKLQALEGAAFDEAYAANEVAYHEAVIHAVDAVLVPNAQNAELKALLLAVRPALQAHLEHARAMHGKLTRAPTTAAHHGAH